MRTLALNDELLLKIDKPARYIGNEVNSVMKNPDSVDIRFAMCFPDVYEIGMSHLGIQILYDMFNQRDDVCCERVYSPWSDLHRIMKEQQIPLFTLENQSPVKDMDFLGITIQYEMCYTNILQILDLSQIPLMAGERTWEHPLVIGGGPCTYNPEPLAEFFDLFYIGEGETRYDELFDLYTAAREKDCSVALNALREGKLPLRVTHNDTKLNNVLMDEATGEGMCIIDLDTVMPGLVLYDFGDSIRFGANHSAEDETDLSKVNLDVDLFQVYTKAFLEGVDGSLTDAEIQYLPWGAKLMTLECGIRFLTDYLDGDNYFHISREGQNLDRCRTQFKLVADMEAHWSELEDIVNQYRK